MQRYHAIRPKVAFIGLPSSGKSSLINSLVGKRILQTGLARTTKHVQYIGQELPFDGANLYFHKERAISDDGFAFDIVDLPGLADAEEKTRDFDELSSEWVLRCDIICWVSDIHTAFLTRHEQQEFDEFRKKLDQHSLESGMCHQLCIILSKYNQPWNDGEVPGEDLSKVIAYQEGEIRGTNEETSVVDCLRRVQVLCSDVHILKFNAFGRVLHGTHASEALRSTVQRLAPGSRNVNTEFTLRWAMDNYAQKRDSARLRSLFEWRVPALFSVVKLGSNCCDEHRNFQNWCPCLRAEMTSKFYSCMDSCKQLIEAIELRDNLNTIFEVFCESTCDVTVEESLLRNRIPCFVGYDECLFNTMCGYFGNDSFQQSSEKTMSEGNDLALFRAYLLLGRTSRRALQSFFSISHHFKTEYYVFTTGIETFYYSSVLRERGSTTFVSLRPPICSFDAECDTVRVASRAWQQRLLQEIGYLWEIDTSDVDAYGLAMLCHKGQIDSVFCRSNFFEQ
jgi:hypothetical protein